MLNRRNVRSVHMAAKTVESADQGVMFTLVKYFYLAWTPLVSVIVYPIQLASSAIQAVTAWREAVLAKSNNSDKTNLFVKAGVYTAATLALGVSLFGVFVASLGSVFLAPALMCAGYALKSLYHFGSAIYNAVKSYQAPSISAREQYKAKAKEDLALGVTGALVSIALGVCLFLHKATFGIMGIVGASVGAIYCATKIKSNCAKESTYTEIEEPKPYQATNASSKATILKGLDISVEAVGFDIGADPVEKPTPAQAVSAVATTQPYIEIDPYLPQVQGVNVSGSLSNSMG